MNGRRAPFVRSQNGWSQIAASLIVTFWSRGTRKGPDGRPAGSGPGTTQTMATERASGFRKRRCTFVALVAALVLGSCLGESAAFAQGVETPVLGAPAEAVATVTEPVAPAAETVQETVTPVAEAVEETVTPVAEETVAPVVEETVAPVAEETVAPVVEETVAPVARGDGRAGG